MLHILWILLKFILILLGILLGLILLAILLILFCPVRYRASAAKDTDSIRRISATARISWLFGGISFRLQYNTGTTISDFHLFGIPVMKLIRKFRSRRSSGRPASSEVQHTDPENKNKNEVRTETRTTFEANAIPQSAHSKDTVDADKDADLEYTRTQIGSFFYRLGIRLRSLSDRINRIWQKICHIPSSVENFTLTIQNICAKIESYQKFLEHPRTKAAFSLVKNRLFRLLRHVFPTRIQGKLTLGSTDPSVTGAVLAVLGMTIPLHKNCVAVTPLFEDRNVLLGNIQMKGRIYGIVLLKTAAELYFNKNIKYVIRRWKHKED